MSKNLKMVFLAASFKVTWNKFVIHHKQSLSFCYGIVEQKQLTRARAQKSPAARKRDAHVLHALSGSLYTGVTFSTRRRFSRLLRVSFARLFLSGKRECGQFAPPQCCSLKNCE